MPTLPFQIITLTADFLIIIFITYYFLKFWAKERQLEKKQNKVDTDYHQIVDDALTKERKILEDATTEADQIIANTQYSSQASKESIDQALQKMVLDVQKEALVTAQDFAKSYQTSLKQIANQSLHDFQNVAKSMENDLQKQIKDFHDTLLPNIEKQVEEYKQARLAETEKTITNIIQKVAQETLNKSISLEDHQTLLIESLEQAKKEGIFQ